MDLLIEAVESITLACTLAVLVPGLGLVLGAGDRSPHVATGYILGLAVTAWARFGGWIPAPDSFAADLALALLLAGSAAAILWRRVDARLIAPAAAVFGASISMYWRPCVGVAFGDVLNEIPDSPWSTLPSMVVFVAVLLLPIAVIAAAPVAFEPLVAVRRHRGVIGVGAATCALVALVVAVGWFDDLMGELFRLSSR